MSVDIRETRIAAYEDERGNRILFDGASIPHTRVLFRGCGATVRVSREAQVQSLYLDMNGNGGEFVLGANRQGRAQSFSVRVGQDSIVTIGDGVSSTGDVTISAVEGSRVDIGSDVMFATANQVRADDGHPIFDVTTGARVNPSSDIVIGDHVWLAWGAVVLGGVTIGSGAVLGLQSVVTHDVPNNAVAAGNPARVVRRDIAWERAHLGLTEPFYKDDSSTIPLAAEYWRLTETPDLAEA